MPSGRPERRPLVAPSGGGRGVRFPPRVLLCRRGISGGGTQESPSLFSLCLCGSQGLSAGGLPTRSPTCRERRFARSFPEGAPGSGPWVRCHRQGVAWCTGSRGRGRLLPQSSSCGCGATSEHPLWPSSRSGAARVAKRRVPRMPQRAAPPGAREARPSQLRRKFVQDYSSPIVVPKAARCAGVCRAASAVRNVGTTRNNARRRGPPS